MEEDDWFNPIRSQTDNQADHESDLFGMVDNTQSVADSDLDDPEVRIAEVQKKRTSDSDNKKKKIVKVRKKSTSDSNNKKKRAVKARKKRSIISLTGSFLLCLILSGAGFYYLQNLPPIPQPVNKPAYSVSPRLPLPARPGPPINTTINNKITDVVVTDVVVTDINTIPTKPIASQTEPDSSVTTPSKNTTVPIFTLSVGPFMNSAELNRATKLLQSLDFKPHKRPGTGPTTMIRLLEGVYTESVARSRLLALEKLTDSAFLLPKDNKLAVYAGSFHQESEAQQLRNFLTKRGVDITLTPCEITMKGTLLIVDQAGQQAAQKAVAHITDMGLRVQMISATPKAH